MTHLLSVPETDAGRWLDLPAVLLQDLAHLERLLAQELSDSRPGVAVLLNHLGPYRGKRLRPLLLFLAARTCGSVLPAHYVLAAVVEMIHTATLVHDDVLDEAQLRRHAATLNASWGNQASVLLGDYLFTHAFYLSSTLGDARLCQLLGEATNTVCAGELHQVAARGNLYLSEAEYFAIIVAKTAALTACCCRLGALVAGAADEQVEALGRYGQELGIVFQITDDLLDLVGEERTTGKSLGSDVAQQKLTLPLIHLLATASAEVAHRLRDILRSPVDNKRDLLHPYLQASGALDYTRQRAAEHARQAQAALTGLPASPWRDLLTSLPQRLLARNR